MPIYARSASGSTKFKPAPAGGPYAATCVDVWEPWTEKSTFEDTEGKLIDKTRLVWVLDAVNEETGKNYEVSQLGTLSLHPKSRLGQLIEAWRGRPFTDEERAKFDWESLIGKHCLLTVVHNKKGDRVYANIGSIMPLGRGMTAPGVPEWFVRKRDRDIAQGVNPHGGSMSYQPQAEADDIPF